MPLLDSSLFNDNGGVPFWPYELLGSPPDNLGQVEDIGMGDTFAGMLANANNESDITEATKKQINKQHEAQCSLKAKCKRKHPPGGSNPRPHD